MHHRLFGVFALCLAASSNAQTLTVNGANSPFTISVPATYSQVTVASGGTLIVDAKLTVTGDMAVRSAAQVTVSPAVMRLQLAVAGTLTVDFGGRIDADGKGLRGAPDAGYAERGATLDPVTFAVMAGSQFGSGGSHATQGRSGNGNAAGLPYGDAVTASPGAGGGTQYGGLAGAGGGVVQISATGLIVNGDIRANGENGVATPALGGGGAGGSVFLSLGTFAGNGRLTANGGVASGSGHGGAGRIKVDFTSSTFNGQCEALSNGEQLGTTLVVDSANRLHVLAPTTLRGGESYSAIVLKPGAVLTLEGSATSQTPLTIPAGATVIVTGPNALSTLTIGTVDGRLEVKSKVVQQADMLLRGTLLLDGELTVTNFETESPAVVTHSASFTGMKLTATAAMHIAAGAQIQGSGLGAPPGGNAQPFGTFGGTYDVVTGTMLAGSGLKNAGSHAGLGGRGDSATPLAPIFDNPLAPQYPGGGGGGVVYMYLYSGGHGGGVVRITASTLRVDGLIAVNGLAAQATNTDVPGGAGAGGTAIITVGSLEGVGGIYAEGGLGRYGAGGGGGIIRLVAGSVAPSVTVSAAGGTGVYPGGAGVVSMSLSTTVKIVSTPVTQVKAGTTFTYAAAATGAAPIAWSLVTAPTGASVSTMGEVSWAAVAGAPQAFSLQASNATGTDVQSFLVVVNDTPSITSTPVASGKVGAPYSYAAEAVGTGPLVWSVSAGPSGLSIDASTGAVSWVPASTGSFAVCLKVSNAGGEAQQCFSVTVTNSAGGGGGVVDDAGVEIPTAPTFVSSPSTTAFCGAPYHYSGSLLPEVRGSRPLTFGLAAISGTTLPEGLGIDAVTGEITWAPSNADTGVHPVVLTVTNGVGQDTQTFSIVVECRASAPTKVGCSCDSSGAGWLALVALVIRRKTRSKALAEETHRPG